MQLCLLGASKIITSLQNSTSVYVASEQRLDRGGDKSVLSLVPIMCKTVLGKAEDLKNRQTKQTTRSLSSHLCGKESIIM